MWLSTTSGKQEPKLLKPLKVYHLSVLSGMPQQRIKLNPPANLVTITIKPGDVAISCGYNSKIYTCVSGKRLEINAEPDNPIEEFWVQNPLSQNVRLSIAVHEYFQGSK